MSRRKPADPPCPCGGGRTYAGCCGLLHRGQVQAATAEELMRSRYAAYAVGESRYLLQTWHPSTRPLLLEPDRTRWIRLEVLETSGGGLLETEGTVLFRAHHRGGVLEERSRFVRDAGRWSYLGPLPD